MRAYLRDLQSLMGGAPVHEAEQLLAAVLGCDWAQLYLGERTPSTGQWDKAKSLARRRAAGEPLQYLIGWVPFMGARIEVGPGVLIPRPETELLAVTALELWHKMGSPLPHTAIDLGTGSGCIALGLALAAPELRVMALDISDSALAWARRNVDANGAGAVVELYRSDFFSALEGLGFPRGGASLILSNPPYVAESERGALPKDVLDHEPATALFSGPRGLEHVERIVNEAGLWLSTPGLLALEVGETQADAVLRMIDRTGAFANREGRKDLAGKPRMVFAWTGS